MTVPKADGTRSISGLRYHARIRIYPTLKYICQGVPTNPKDIKKVVPKSSTLKFVFVSFFYLK